MPFVNQEALFKMTARTLFEKDENELEGLVQPMQQQLPPELMAMAQGGQAPAGPEGMPQQGMGEMASMPMSDVEAGATNQAMQAQGMNIPGMPQ